MIIKKDEIELNGGAEFFKFVSSNDLFGAIQLKEPILDTSGNVLIKEKVNLNETLVKKISGLEGKHVSILRVNISKGLTEKLAQKIAKETLIILEDKEDQFINHLYKNNLTGNSVYRSVIENAFYNKRLSMFAFRLFSERRDFFRHSVKLGLLSLGAVIQRSHQLRMVNRYSYLSGFFCDLCILDSTIWKEDTVGGEEMTIIARQSAIYMQKLGLPLAIHGAHSTANLQGLQIDRLNKPNMTVENMNVANSFFEYSEDEKEEDTEELTQEETNQVKEIVSEALKITRFIQIAKRDSTEGEDHQKQVVTSFAYNMEKGLFKKEIAEPMLAVFKHYELQIRKIRNVAKIENMCLFKPSAWAYPKPEPTQILCKDKKIECPHLVNGWDINIFSEQNAYGYIGARLRPGQYPKCRLEEKLKDLKSVSKPEPEKQKQKASE